ncbi:hypothetical protein VTO42DRAFT_6708 [Malbranchea cinnamomea]
MTKDHYDSDDACNRSPSLEPSKVVYEPHQSPAPFISDKSESPESKPSPTGPDCADQPNLVHELVTKPFRSHVSSEASDSVRGSPTETEAGLNDEFVPDGRSTTATTTTEAFGPRLNSTEVKHSDPDGRSTSEPKSHDEGRPATRQVTPRLDYPIVTADRDVPVGLFQTQTSQGPVLPRITTEYPYERLPVVTSPALRHFTIPPSDSFTRGALPALQSPAISSSANSPTTSLPSLKATLLDEFSETRLKDQTNWLNGSSPLPLPAPSPPYPRSPLEPVRRPPEQLLPPPLLSSNPYIHSPSPGSQTLSTVSSTPSTAPSQPSPSQLSPWNASSVSERSFTISPGDSTSQFSENPNSGYPSPNEPRKRANVEQKPPEGKRKSTEPSNAGGFKCSYPGCTAPPFQTQYLLNSHANVHSQDRPYFCPIKGCPRGEGGQGFKRKNEMIRHGLVHDSPGYVCPFCTDQQHKYPRPDNLQRHVRVHHVDKDKDDPLLRQVLAQRPEGLSRGRKRRA